MGSEFAVNHFGRYDQRQLFWRKNKKQMSASNTEGEGALTEMDTAMQSTSNESSALSEELTPAQLAELKAKAAKADEHFHRLLLTTADLENFKKRAARERDEARRNAIESVLGKILPVLDNFDMAMAAASQSATTLESQKAGVSMIQNQLQGAMCDLGLEELEALGKVFDPSMHEAVSQQESTEVPEGHVLVQLRKGYRLRDRLIRPASVVVARKVSEGL